MPSPILPVDSRWAPWRIPLVVILAKTPPPAPVFEYPITLQVPDGRTKVLWVPSVGR
jgi:hypothetical protein